VKPRRRLAKLRGLGQLFHDTGIDDFFPDVDPLQDLSDRVDGLQELEQMAWLVPAGGGRR
jgi:hypothetical protein